MMNGPSLSGARWYWLFAAWAISLIATFSALFLSEVMGLIPCEHCWHQRIVMSPLVGISGVGLASSDVGVFKYALPLVVLGWLLSVYHNLLYIGFIPEALQPCGAGPSCAKADLNLLGFISIPLLSFSAFTALAIILVTKIGRKK